MAVNIVRPFKPQSGSGHKYIPTAVDFSTIWPEAVPLKNTEATTVAENLEEEFCHAGIPQQVLSDWGTQFSSTKTHVVLCLLPTNTFVPHCSTHIVTGSVIGSMVL